jgi:centrosomal protein CEP19
MSAAALAAAGNPLSAIAGIGDLNRVKPAALQAAKAKMQVVFDANVVARGDAGFVYDKRVDFTPRAGQPTESDWDD